MKPNLHRSRHLFAGRLSQRIWARGIVTDYAYDGWGSLTNTVYPDGTPTVTLFYDAMGRQTNSVDAAGVTTFRYDDFGSLTNETVVGAAGENTIIRHWDAYGRTTGYSLVGRVVPNAPQSPAADTLEYAYQYDDIGNRITSTDLGTNRTYTANSLNQYTLISNLCASVTLCDGFFPQFDDDGNQTLIQTSTGIWQVQYNGENRPVLWTGGTQAAMTNIVMSFDRMGRRVEYLETAGGSQSSEACTSYVRNVPISMVDLEINVFMMDVEN